MGVGGGQWMPPMPMQPMPMPPMPHGGSWQGQSSSSSGGGSSSSRSCSNGHCISTSVMNGKLYVNGEVVAEVLAGTATNVQARDGQVFLNGRKVWPRTVAVTTTVAAPAPVAPAECKKRAFDQCGGKYFKGDTCCPSGYCCNAQNVLYSQCE